MKLLLILTISTIATIYLIRKLFSWMHFFHWLEYICVTLFVLSISAHSFNGYSSAFPSLELTEKIIPYLIVHDHYVVLYPLIFIWVLQLIRRKKPLTVCLLATLSWFIGYFFLVFLDVHFGVLRIQGSYWTPIIIIASYNVVLIISSIFFMKGMQHTIRKEMLYNE